MAEDITQKGERESKKSELLESIIIGASALIGVSPIPIAGELCCACALKRIFNKTGIGRNNLSEWLLSLATTVALRNMLYPNTIYNCRQVYQKICEYF
jgi:hypothetical protein